MKKVNLSESTNKNSSELTKCPSCKGKGCNYCFNSGQVSKKRASRYKEEGKKSKKK